jgi:outer membrane protein
MRSISRATTLALLISGLAGAAGAQQAAIKIAYVNSQALMEAAPGRAAASDLLNKEGQGYQVQLQKMQDSINGLYAAYQKAEPTLSATVKESRQKTIRDLETAFQAKQLEFQKTFDDHTKEVMAPITDQVKKVIDDIRVEEGYSIILDNAPGAGNIVSADKNLDITDKIVSRLRATPAAKITAPSTTQPTKPGAPATPAGVGKPPIKPPTR